MKWKISYASNINAIDYGAFFICVSEFWWNIFRENNIRSYSRIVIFSRLRERINVITRLLANCFTDRAFFVTIDYPVRRVCYGGGTLEIPVWSNRICGKFSCSFFFLTMCVLWFSGSAQAKRNLSRRTDDDSASYPDDSK